MKTRLFAGIFGIFCLFGTSYAADAGYAALEEKVNRLNAQVEDLQVRNQQLQKNVETIQGELQELRRVAAAGGGVSPSELKAIDDRIQAVDNARKADRQAIIDQLSKELAGLSTGKKPAPVADAKEHVVAKGDTLSSIAKSYKISVAELKKANSLTGDDLKIGQKLTIPK